MIGLKTDPINGLIQIREDQNGKVNKEGKAYFISVAVQLLFSSFQPE
jgi:hypothetical protein